MTVDTGQYISLTEAQKKFNVSVSTLRRQRDRLRNSEDPLATHAFVVETSDGEVFEKPSGDLVTKLNSQGRSPEWLVNLVWLEKEKGARKTTESSDAIAEHDDVGSSEQPSTTPNEQGEHGSSPPLNTQVTTVETALRELIDAKDEVIQAKDEQIQVMQRFLPESIYSSPRDSTSATDEVSEQEDNAQQPTERRQSWLSRFRKSWLSRLLFGSRSTR